MVAQPTASSVDSLVQTLAEQVRAAAGAGNYPEEIARAVAAYCELHPWPRPLPFSYLTLLLSRACAGAGDPASARRVVEMGLPNLPHRERMLEVVGDVRCAPGLVPFVASGLLRPARWTAAGSTPSWTIDFGRLSVQHREAVELAYFQAVRDLVTAVAEVFAAHQGRGLLAVKNLGAPLRSLLGGAPAEATIRRLMRDTLAVVAWALAKTAACHEWPYTPQVMLLDPPS